MCASGVCVYHALGFTGYCTRLVWFGHQIAWLCGPMSVSEEKQLGVGVN